MQPFENIERFEKKSSCSLSSACRDDLRWFCSLRKQLFLLTPPYSKGRFAVKTDEDSRLVAYDAAGKLSLI